MLVIVTIKRSADMTVGRGSQGRFHRRGQGLNLALIKENLGGQMGGDACR